MSTPRVLAVIKVRVLPRGFWLRRLGSHKSALAHFDCAGSQEEGGRGLVSSEVYFYQRGLSIFEAKAFFVAGMRHRGHIDDVLAPFWRDRLKAFFIRVAQYSLCTCYNLAGVGGMRGGEVLFSGRRNIWRTWAILWKARKSRFLKRSSFLTWHVGTWWSFCEASAALCMPWIHFLWQAECFRDLHEKVAAT